MTGREKVLSDALQGGCPWCGAGDGIVLAHYPDCDLLAAFEPITDAVKPSVHPWSSYLYFRHACIKWLLSEGNTFDQVASILSMDPVQVQLISLTPLSATAVAIEDNGH